MYKYLCSMEKERRPKMDYMKILQKDINPYMRGLHVDWLAKVADDCNLYPDVFYLGVSYIDRYLSFHPINESNLQLLCTTSMYIASKYEDISTSNVEIFSEVTCNCNTKEEILELENKILKTLNFDLNSPTTRTFIRMFNEITREELNDPLSYWKFKLLTEYLGELSLLEYECLRFLPSLVAASITLLARFILWPDKRPCWTLTLQQYTEYNSFELKECVIILHDLFMYRRGKIYKYVRKKYSEQEYQHVANLYSSSNLPSYLFEVEVDSQPKTKKLKEK